MSYAPPFQSLDRAASAYQRGAYEAGATGEGCRTSRLAAAAEAIHRRLLERATGGRLTWRGDTIVEIQRTEART